MPALLRQQIAALQVDAEPFWLGPCAPGPNGGVTQSMLQRYLACGERFRVKYVLGLEPPQKFEKAMEYGNMWHLCEEALAGVGGPGSDDRIWPEVEARLDDYVAQLYDKYPMQRQDVDKWANVCRVQFPEYVKYWADHPDVQDRRPLMQEAVFDVPYKLPSGRVVRLRGKFDSVDLIPSQGGIYLQENKTKGDIDPVQLQRQLSFDLQTMMYQVALQGMARDDHWFGYESEGHYASDTPPHPICGVRYNVVRRPLSGGKGSIKQHEQKVTKPRYGTGRNAGKMLDPGKIVPAETDAEFYERLRRDYIAAEPDYWFFRIISRVSQHDVEVFKQQCLDPLLENLCDDAEWWTWVMTCSSATEVGMTQWDYTERARIFPRHCHRHFRYPFGCWNALNESGFTEYDSYLETGNAAGLQRAKHLFPELETT